MNQKIALVIESDEIFRDEWVEKLSPDYSVLTFSQPINAFYFLDDNQNKVSQIEVIIVDRMSNKYDSVKQRFGEDMRERYRNFQGKIVVYSGIYNFPHKIKGFDLALPKISLTKNELFELIAKKSIEADQ